MPKCPTARRTQRTAPYDSRPSTASATSMATLMSPVVPAGWTANGMHHHHHSNSWSQPTMHYPQYMMADHSMSHMTTPVLQPLPPILQQADTSVSRQPGQSGPWSQDEDQVLVDAKGQGLGWNELCKKYFPQKSGNACRKRHERLMAKRNANWSDDRIMKVRQVYNKRGMREQVWKTLAQHCGEKWEDIERVVCVPFIVASWDLTLYSAFNKD